MDEPGRLGVRAFGAGVHAPGLEVAADRAGRDLAKSPLPRQPDLDVIGLLRREAHVAGAERHRAKVQTEAFEYFLGALRHPLVLFPRLLGRCDRNELDLLELVLADYAARVAPGGSGFRAEGQSRSGEAERQGLLVDDALANEIGKRNLGGGDEPEFLG